MLTGVAEVSEALLIAVATEAGSEALVTVGFASTVMVSFALWTLLSGLPVPLGLPVLGDKDVDPASSRMDCLGRGEWMLSITPPEPAIASSTLPGEMTERLGD